jgi:large subunit ribosomal protein L13
MDALSYKKQISKQSHRYKGWIVVDADGHNLGRPSKVAMILEVSKPSYTRTLTVGIT